MFSEFTVVLTTCFESDPWAGVKNYTAAIAAELKSRDNVNVVVVLPPLHSTRQYFIRGLSRTFLYPMMVRRCLKGIRGPCILHVTDQMHAMLISGKSPAVATCHDLALFRYPYLAKSQMKRWMSRVANLRLARLVFADSQNTERDLKEYLSIGGEKILVNSLGVDADFRQLPAGHVFGSLGKKLEDMKRGRFLLLHVGKRFFHKNIPVLLEAVKRAKDAGVPVRLVKVGDSLLDSEFSAQIERLGLKDDISDLGTLSRNDLVEAYNKCDLLLFPSKYEGFGFPVVEAQACGLPAAISNSASLPEVGGDGALYHDPDDSAMLADCIVNVFKSPVLKKELMEKGYLNSRRFTWKAHVDCLIESYKCVLALPKDSVHYAK